VALEKDSEADDTVERPCPSSPRRSTGCKSSWTTGSGGIVLSHQAAANRVRSRQSPPHCL